MALKTYLRPVARKITEAEALAKASKPQALDMMFKGIFLDEGRRILQ